MARQQVNVSGKVKAGLGRRKGWRKSGEHTREYYSSMGKPAPVTSIARAQSARPAQFQPNPVTDIIELASEVYGLSIAVNDEVLQAKAKELLFTILNNTQSATHSVRFQS